MHPRMMRTQPLTSNSPFLHSHRNPHVNIICWVRRRRHLRPSCMPGHVTLTQGSRVPPSCSSARSMGGGRVQLRQKAQPAAPYLALHRGNRKLCTNLRVSFTATFATMTFHSFAFPPQRQRWPRVTATMEASFQERGSHILLALQAQFCCSKETPRHRQVRNT